MKTRALAEKVILGLIYLLLVSFHIYNGITFSKTLFWVHIHTVTSGIIVGIIFFGNVFYLYPKYFSKSKKKYAVKLTVILIVGYMIESIVHAYKASALIKDQRGLDYSPLNMIFQKFNLQESIMMVSITFFLSIIYLYFKESIISKRESGVGYL